MKIYGLQKMTLLDFPGKVACTVFTGGCDLRCVFCHNYELATGKAEPYCGEEEFFSFLEKRRGLIDGVAVTGGEPCLQKDLPEFLKKVRALGFSTKLDTNGFHPEMLKRIVDEKLADYIAVDVKNSPEKYAATCGLEKIDLAPLFESLAILKDSGAEYELRTTVVDQLHDEEDVKKIGEMIRGTKFWFIQCFADRDTVPFAELSAPPREKLKRFLDIARGYVPGAELRGAEL
ncbi:MAG: anaerobic ribonucleoside-triphosphate reductase activating protein [Clostridia bacterium]|nr:anaerobic ribonucleoside-triphosphate reductase activating protein [Clostridia bacterium]